MDTLSLLADIQCLREKLTESDNARTVAAIEIRRLQRDKLLLMAQVMDLQALVEEVRIVEDPDGGPDHLCTATRPESEWMEAAIRLTRPKQEQADAP